MLEVTRSLPLRLALAFGVACGGGHAATNAAVVRDAATVPSFPLVLVADVELTGSAGRFDYQDVDAKRGHLVIAHMNDASVVVVDLKDGAVVKTIANVPTARGVIVADEVARIFVTSSPDQIVMIDADSLAEVGRVKSGNGPDGIAWDPDHRIVGVSDQRDGAISLIADAGTGARTPIPLGSETGNVVYDRRRRSFWITVAGGGAVGRLVEIDPLSATKKTTIDLPDCEGAHGLRVHPDGRSAFVACEDNAKLVRVELDGNHGSASAKTGRGPDVLAVDPSAGFLYVAAESGDLAVFDLARPGVEMLDQEHPADDAHTVAVDPTSHRVFLPLAAGPGGKPVLRIMRPGP